MINTKEQTLKKAKKKIEGRVVSDKMDKTRVILIERLWKHPRTGKYLKRSRKIKVHDPKNQSQHGDLISAFETRPLSKEKHHCLLSVLEKAK